MNRYAAKANRPPEHASQPGPGLVACLTIRQPWAHLIVTPHFELPDGVRPKRIENRTWSTTHRGRLIICSSKARQMAPGVDPSLYEHMIYGCALASCNLIAIVEQSWTKMPRGLEWVRGNEYAEQNCFNWVLDDVKRFTVPVPIRGQLGLFYVPEAVFRQSDLPEFLTEGQQTQALDGERSIDFQA